MAEVKRYELDIQPGYYDRPYMAEDDTGDYVLHSDYAAVKAERDELARTLLSGPRHCACQKFRNTMSGQERLPHLPGCPVALAEKIVKEEKP